MILVGGLMKGDLGSLVRRVSPWVFIFTAVVLVYLPALATFFSQDDFSHLYLSQATSFRDFLRFFVPVSTGIFYRPLSVQIYTWLSRLLFGLNPLGFHLLALGFHLFNTYLVYLLFKKLLQSEKLSLLGAFFYGVHVSHFMSVFWPAEFSMVLAPFFVFLAINAFLDQRYYRFWLWAFLGLLSNELASTVPLILGLYIVFLRQWTRLKWLVPPALGVLGLFVLRFILFPASLGSQYVLSFSLATFLRNLRWYALRAVGLPEGFLAFLQLSSVRLALVALVLAALAVLFLVWSNRGQTLKTAFTSRFSLAIFGALWFTVAVLPVGFLRQHQSPIYQIIGLPGFFLMLAAFLPKLKSFNLSLLVFTGFYFVASFWGVRAQNQYHWVTKRARLAKYHIEKLNHHQPGPQDVVAFLNTSPQSSTQAYLAMAGDKAVKVFFGDGIKVEFEDFSELTFSKKAFFVFSQDSL